jgi:gliding motility-associated-like protein
MKKLFLFCFILISLKSTSQCVQINSIFVNSCTVGTGTGFCDSEGYNEMFTFTVGNSNLNVSDIAVVWPNNAFQGWCRNALTALKTDSLNNSIISSCGYLKEPPGGVIPAGAEVIVITSENFCVAANSFEGLADTMFIIYQCNGVSTGYFANNLSSGQTRTLTVNVFGSCNGTTSATYDSSIPVVDGATALFDEFGNVTYVINGCNAPVITRNPFWSFASVVCESYGDINLNSLLAFNATSGGTWSGAGVSGSTFNPAGLSGSNNITYTVTGSGDCPESSDSTIVFTVENPMLNSQTVQSCDSAFVNGQWYFADDFITFVTPPSIPYSCGIINEIDIEITEITIDSNYIFSCNPFEFNGVVYSNNIIIRDTVFGTSGGPAIADTLLSTSFLDSEGWTNQTTVANGTWTTTTADGNWIGFDMYANGGNTNTGNRKIGFNNVGDWFQLPPVDNPQTLYYYVMLSGVPTGTHELTIQYFDGTNWVDVQANIITNTTYAQIIVDLSSLSGITNVLLRIYVSQRGIRSFFVDDIVVEGIVPPPFSTCDQITITNIEISTPAQFDTIRLCTNNSATAGTQSDTLFSVALCDSLITFTITELINPVSNTTFLCTNNPAEVGTVTDTLLSLLGCDSVYNQAITTLVNPTSEITFECTNNAANAGVFTDTILSTLGCDSVYLERNVAFVSVTTQTVAQLCTNNAAQAGVFNDTIFSSLGCDSIINQTFVELISPVTIASDVACTNIPSEATTVYTDTLYSSQGCDSIYFAENTVWVEFNSTQFSLEACDSLKIGGITYYENYQRNDTLFSALGCDSIVEIFTVTINQSPEVDAGEDITINQGEAATLEATATGATEFLWEWATGNTQQNPFTVNPLETTIYTITVSNEKCSSQDAITVFVQNINVELFIPDAFTPNGDGINDIFEVANKEFFTDITMNIFNRWGELIHKEAGINHGWDGTYKGELQNPGVFVYFITAKNLSGTQSYTAKGSVTLIR